MPRPLTDWPENIRDLGNRMIKNANRISHIAELSLDYGVGGPKDEIYLRKSLGLIGLEIKKLIKNYQACRDSHQVADNVKWPDWLLSVLSLVGEPPAEGDMSILSEEFRRLYLQCVSEMESKFWSEEFIRRQLHRLKEKSETIEMLLRGYGGDWKSPPPKRLRL